LALWSTAPGKAKPGWRADKSDGGQELLMSRLFHRATDADDGITNDVEANPATGLTREPSRAMFMLI
jgi:hypothetical protein